MERSIQLRSFDAMRVSWRARGRFRVQAWSFLCQGCIAGLKMQRMIIGFVTDATVVIEVAFRD